MKVEQISIFIENKSGRLAGSYPGAGGQRSQYSGLVSGGYL